MSSTEQYGTFWDHIEDLRRVIVRSIIIIVSGILFCFAFCDYLIAFLEAPFHNMVFENQKRSAFATSALEFKKIQNTSSESRLFSPSNNEKVIDISDQVVKESFTTFKIPPNGYVTIENEKKMSSLNILSPIEGMIIAFKVSCWAGFILTAPFWCWGVLSFIAPALPTRGVYFGFLFFILSWICLSLGGVLAYYLTIPIANSYLWNFNTSIGHNIWALKPYLEYTILLLVANGVAFEGFLILLFLVHFRIISAEALATKRRHFVVLAFIIAALLTPPDVLTQFLLAIPLIILYECAIFYAYVRNGAYRIFSRRIKEII